MHLHCTVGQFRAMCVMPCGSACQKHCLTLLALLLLGKVPLIERQSLLRMRLHYSAKLSNIIATSCTAHALLLFDQKDMEPRSCLTAYSLTCASQLYKRGGLS